MVKKIYNGPASGFPEFLPELRRVEQNWLDVIRKVFESYGYTSIETSAVELVSTIIAKGDDVDKEIYTLGRLNNDAENLKQNTSQLALHFDLTIPLARYVSQNYNDLTFPFKRYQMQKVWRGERAQEGRYREFLQCDIDVIDNNVVSHNFDAEMPKLIHKIMNQLGINDIQTHINNRKIIQGYYTGIGITDTLKVIRIIDKIEKIGKEEVLKLLTSQAGLSVEIANKCIELAEIQTNDTSFVEKILNLGVSNVMLNEGIEELRNLMNNFTDLPKNSVIANLSIARGLDYYTGTVFEGRFVNYNDSTAIFAGGRYENLVGDYLNKSLPGVGISIGLTRILLKLLKENRLNIDKKSPTDILVINFTDSNYQELCKKAELLRDNNINVEVYHDNTKKISTQIQYAVKKGIKYILLISKQQSEIKNLETFEQYIVSDLTKWQP